MLGWDRSLLERGLDPARAAPLPGAAALFRLGWNFRSILRNRDRADALSVAPMSRIVPDHPGNSAFESLLSGRFAPRTHADWANHIRSGAAPNPHWANMSTPLESALRRLAALKEEAIWLENLIRTYRELSGVGRVVENPTSARLNIDLGGNVSLPSIPVDNSEKVPMSRRRGAKPDEIAHTVQRIIGEVGKPMTRGQLVQALERRDVQLQAADKARYIGTIVWRHKSIFVNIEGRGYWLRGMPLDAKPTGRPSSRDLEEDEGESM